MQIYNNFFVNHEQNNLELFLNHKFRVRDTRADSLPGGGRMEFLWGMNILFENFLISRCKGRVILEGRNVSLENSGHQLMCI